MSLCVTISMRLRRFSARVLCSVEHSSPQGSPRPSDAALQPTSINWTMLMVSIYILFIYRVEQNLLDFTCWRPYWGLSLLVSYIRITIFSCLLSLDSGVLPPPLVSSGILSWGQHIWLPKKLILTKEKCIFRWICVVPKTLSPYPPFVKGMHQFLWVLGFGQEPAVFICV